MLEIKKLHHIAIICSDYEKSKAFYTSVLGLEIKNEIYRSERKSYKLDLCLNGEYLIELFSFSDPPKRPTHPEASRLRHIAFEVENIEEYVEQLKDRGVSVEPIRIDEFTNKKFTFMPDPDNLPIEIYEQ